MLDDPPEVPPPTPQPANQVLFLNSKTMAPAGGRAAGLRGRTAGSRFSKPTAEDREYYEATRAEREAAIDNDPVTRVTAGRDPIATLAMVKAEVAREAAALAYQRALNEMTGRDISQVSARRIDALKKIADIEIEQRKMGFDSVDVHSEKMQRIFKLFVEIVGEVAAETLNPEQLDLFVNRLTTAMEGWEDKAEELVR